MLGVVAGSSTAEELFGSGLLNYGKRVGLGKVVEEREENRLTAG